MNWREKVLTAGAIVFLCWAGWDIWSFAPSVERIASERARLVEHNAMRRQLLEEIASTPRLIEASPKIENRARADALEAQLKASRARGAELARSFIAPEDLPRVLEQLVVDRTGLNLVEIELRAPTVRQLNGSTIQLGGQSADLGIQLPKAQLFEHHAELTVQGAYQEVLHYLALLQNSRWRFFYSSINYSVQEYPQALVTLHLYTLSTNEG
jgi:MSHA biogenesis protein MshJ